VTWTATADQLVPDCPWRRRAIHLHQGARGVSTFVPIDYWLASNGHTLSDQLRDPKASYLYWQIDVRAETAPGGIDQDLEPVRVAVQADQDAWQSIASRPGGHRRRRGARRPGARKTLLERRDLAELVHGLCRQQQSLARVAEAIGCSQQSLRDVFVHHGLGAAIKPRRCR
jgi:hypothetical protein